mmetsp:Transcript_84623/g.168056  ORF Transcript_84623/g.168056 Transcript_84623/m.168056 type:complete len:246 (-) Transcript_84623:45-782(-)
MSPWKSVILALAPCNGACSSLVVAPCSAAQPIENRSRPSSTPKDCSVKPSNAAAVAVRPTPAPRSTNASNGDFCWEVGDEANNVVFGALLLASSRRAVKTVLSPSTVISPYVASTQCAPGPAAGPSIPLEPAATASLIAAASLLPVQKPELFLKILDNSSSAAIAAPVGIAAVIGSQASQASVPGSGTTTGRCTRCSSRSAKIASTAALVPSSAPISTSASSASCHACLLTVFPTDSSGRSKCNA